MEGSGSGLIWGTIPHSVQEIEGNHLVPHLEYFVTGRDVNLWAPE
jgi:hypothetical protein